MRLCLEDEAPQDRLRVALVTCQFRGDNVLLHHAGFTSTVRRSGVVRDGDYLPGFKDIVAGTKAARRRSVSNRDNTEMK